MTTDKNIKAETAKESLGEFADKVGEEDVKDTLGKEDEIKKLFKRVKVLAKYFNDLCEILELLRDRVKGTYTETPWRTIFASGSWRTISFAQRAISSASFVPMVRYRPSLSPAARRSGTSAWYPWARYASA